MGKGSKYRWSFVLWPVYWLLLWCPVSTIQWPELWGLLPKWWPLFILSSVCYKISKPSSEEIIPDSSLKSPSENSIESEWKRLCVKAIQTSGLYSFNNHSLLKRIQKLILAMLDKGSWSGIEHWSSDTRIPYLGDLLPEFL